MIKLFRRIRFNLMETGKTSKYFKYAIGEIVLVVIGILIALQINTWNENRKQNNQELYTLKQLKVEFEADSKKLDNILSITEGKITALKNLYRIVSEQKSDSIKLPMVFFTGEIIPFYDYSPTYDELVSSGNLNMISNDSIKNAINDFINHNELVETTIYPNIQQQKSAYMNHVFKYFNGDLSGKLWERKLSIKEMEALGADYKGYTNDHQTKTHLNLVLAGDSKFLFIGRKNITNKLNNVLELLNKELAKHD
jgi:hypothetical protein